MIDATQLASMRATAQATLTEAAVQKRLTRTADGAGGWTETWNTVGTTVAASRTAELTAQEEAIAERLAIARPWIVRVPAGTDILEADRLIFGSDTFEVVQRSGRTLEITRRVVCRQIV